MSSVLEDKSVIDKLATVSGATSIGKCEFIYNTDMQKQWIESSNQFLDYAGSKYSQSARSFLEAGKIVITEVDESVLVKFETEADIKAHAATLKHWEKE